MAKTLIFEEQAVSFALESSFGVYVGAINPPVFALEKGETYTILWDGVEYVCVGDDITLSGMYLQGVGNRALQGGENTGEPFAIASAQTDGVPHYNAMMTADTAASHTVAIWHGAEDAAIILKDRDGNPAQFQGATAVNLLMQDGTEQLFIPETDIPVAVEKTVSPDFSGGDMVVVPDANKVLSKVTVQKPENLVPSNIAKDVSIAGIVGVMVAGSNAKIKTGKLPWPNAGGVLTIEHGLGVLPDFILVSSDMNYQKPYANVVYGLSSAFLSGAGNGFAWGGIVFLRDDIMRTNTPMDELTTGPYVHNVTSESFTVGGNNATMFNVATYCWLAIGGLT